MDVVRGHGLGYKMHSSTLFPDPESAFRYGNFLFAVTIIGDLLLTFYVIQPDFSHDVTVIAGGYYNLCVALDYFPANYIAAIGYHFVQACWWWSCFRFLARAKVCLDEGLISHELLTFLRIGGLIFSTMTPVMLLCLMRKPHLSSIDSLIFHVRGFEFQIVGCAVWIFAQWVFAMNVVSRHRPYLATYTATVFIFCTASFVKIHFHQDTIDKWVHLAHPELARAQPWYVYFTSVPQINDWIWVASLPATGAFSPLQGWSPTGDYFEASRGVGAHMGEHPPYVKVPEEDEATNAQLAKDVADAFVTGFHGDFKEDPNNNEDWGVTAGMVKATFEIDEERIQLLHPDLRVGLMAKGGKYDALIRINISILGTVRMSTRLFLPDSVPTSSLLKSSIRLPDEVLSGKPAARKEEAPKVADLLFAEDLKEFLAPWGEHLCAIKNFRYKDTGLNKLFRLLWWLRAFLAMKKAIDTDIEHTHPGDVFSGLGIWGKSYYGGLPFRLGPGCCKWGIEPMQEHDIGTGPPVADIQAKGTPYAIYAEAVKTAKERFIPTAESFLTKGDAKFKFKVQVASNKDKHDLYKADAVWCEDTSPYMTVGTLTIPKGQKFEKLRKEIGDGLLFDVYNNFKDHRPVGPMNNARHEVYKQHGKARMAAYKQCPVLGRMSHA